MNQYPHMCRDGHPEIGFATDEELCPVCKAKAEINILQSSIVDLTDYIGDVLDLADDLHYKSRMLNEVMEHRAKELEGLG